MRLRKCSQSEAQEAANKYGSKDEHEFKADVMGSYRPPSNYDIFIDVDTKEVYIANKDGSGAQDTGVYLR